MNTENMTFSEALEAMMQGYKVKLKEWKNWYIGINTNGCIIDEEGNLMDGLTDESIMSDHWEIYNEPKPEPQFKVGDVIFSGLGNSTIGMVTGYTGNMVDMLNPVVCEKFAASCNKGMHLATSEEIDEWNRQLHALPEGHRKHYSRSKRKLVDWFEPFDKIVCRYSSPISTWFADLFSHYQKSEKVYYTLGGCQWNECVPYNEITKHLLGTTDNYDNN